MATERPAPPPPALSATHTRSGPTMGVRQSGIDEELFDVIAGSKSW